MGAQGSVWSEESPSVPGILYQGTKVRNGHARPPHWPSFSQLCFTALFSEAWPKIATSVLQSGWVRGWEGQDGVGVVEGPGWRWRWWLSLLIIFSANWLIWSDPDLPVLLMHPSLSFFSAATARCVMLPPYVLLCLGYLIYCTYSLSAFPKLSCFIKVLV